MIDIDLIAATRAACVSGEALRIRRRSGVSLREMAEACATSASSVGQWERGEHLPGTQAAMRYGRVLIRLRDAGRKAAA